MDEEIPIVTNQPGNDSPQLARRDNHDVSWRPVWGRWRELMVCALVFQAAEAIVFAPLLGMAGKALSGRAVVDSTQIVSFVLSPAGLLVVFLGMASAVALRLVEHAGLSAITLGAIQGKVVSTRAAFGFMLKELPRLMSLVTRVIGLGLAVLSPVLIVAAVFAARLLPKHDINYYLAAKPPEFITAAIVIGFVAAVVLCVGAWLFVRWRLIVQVCVFGRLAARPAFSEAAALGRGAWWSLAARCAGIIVLEAGLVVAAAGLGQFAAWIFLNSQGMAGLSLVLSLAILLLLRTATSAVVMAVGACVEAGVFTVFYHRRRLAVSGVASKLQISEVIDPSRATAPRNSRGLALVLVLVVFASAVLIAFLSVRALSIDQPITVTAHRGYHAKAPENTAAAVREAIAVGAQYAEIDVQLSKDGVLVVTHDSDFSRMAGVAKKVWDLNYDEIRAIPLGARSAPEFRNEPAPTFAEVLDIAKDKIKLNVELKYYGDHQPRLAERVVDEVRAHGMMNQVIIQCLEYDPLQEVHRLAPEIPVGYLLSVNARHPQRLDVSFLGAALSRATGAFVQAAHRRGQEVHVWTVDKPDDMERMIDIGVDSLITNQPAEALRLLRERQNLSHTERVMRGVRAMLAD